MSVVETASGAGKHGDVAQSLAGTVTAQMSDLHVRQVSQLSLSLHPQGEVEVLEIEKVALVKPVHGLQRGRAEQHEATTDDGNAGARLMFGQVSHLIAGQTPVKQLSDALRREATQHKVQHRGEALAGMLLVSFAITYGRAECHYRRCGLQVLQ